MFVADAHCDTLYSIGVNGRSLYECAVTPERMRLGGVGLQTFAMFAGPKGPAGHPYEKARAMLTAAERLPIPIFDKRLPDAPPDAPSGVLSLEGGEILEGSIERLDEFDHMKRIRLIALTWNHENEIGFPASAGSTGGLKPFGKALLKEMDARGIYADVSHLNVAGFWDVCEHASLGPVASHSNCRWLCTVPRNLYKRQVRAIIARNGFIGVNFYSAFLRRAAEPTLETVFRHIDAICELGGQHVVGFGSDFDGIDRWPEGLGNPEGFPALIDTLRAHGYSEQAIADIAGLNYWRLLKRAEQARKAAL